MAEGSKNEVLLRELRETLPPWCRERELRLCVLFGSRATGRARPGSDVDLAVWPSPPGARPSGRQKLDWIGDLTLLLEPEVNLVVVSPELDPVLGREISRDGRVLYEAEENVWAWERLRLWQLYNDALPFLRRQKEDLRRYAEEVGRRGA